MKQDLQSIAALCLAIFLIMVTTLIFVGISQWLAGVAWRLGLVSDAAQVLRESLKWVSHRVPVVLKKDAPS